MNVSFYTVDDLRLGQTGQRVSRFLAWQDALAHYRALPQDTVKSLGIARDEQSLELVRRLPVSETFEDVLTAEFLSRPLQQEERTALLRLLEVLVPTLRIGLCLAEDQLVPLPEDKPLPRGLADKYLWYDRPGEENSTRCWIYAAGEGWLSPQELARRFPDPDRTFRYPMVSRYRLDGVAADGSFVPLEATYWEYQQLKRRTRQRLQAREGRRAG